jgi:predicted lipid-binding transport protein (Tim44 family)
MEYCPKCGSEVTEEMAFCPKCGAALRLEQPVTRAAPAPQRAEKAEKREKQEKQEKQEPEKGEKHEKRQYGFIGPLIGGLILIFIGLITYIQVTGLLSGEIAGALILVVIGIIVIVVGFYAYMMAMRRHPRA